MAKMGMGTRWTGSSCSRATAIARLGVGFNSKDADFVDFNLSLFASLVLRGNGDFQRTPLNLSGRELGGLVADAIAAFFSSVTFAEKRAELDLRTDWTLETVLVRQAFANVGSCSFAKPIEFIVVAWGLEASCEGTMIGLE